MASSIFLDTNGWLTLLNSTEALHVQANRTWLDVVRGKHQLILTDWIVAEAGNGLARVKPKNRLHEALDRILAVSYNQMVFIDDQLLNRAIEFFERHADKSWGLVDCASFLVMQERGITHAFTSDRHFEQAGFTCLLPLQ